ncbi:MAG: glycoside hydrolase [SAR202 cluster bacterium]|nr:glycoside hydrolase [SAR202 cluster bacterium]|tara:strand:+ start:2584 stop:4524 length:1941 start_codon:yes stop_codon:yes gene_type:complete
MTNQNQILVPIPKKHITKKTFFEPNNNTLIFYSKTQNIDSTVLNKLKIILSKLVTNTQITSVNKKSQILLSIELNKSLIQHPQGYKLNITKNQIQIIAHDNEGAWHASTTLQQIIQNHSLGVKIPCSYIEDWPDYPNRGVMLDISRDKVPNLQTLKDLVSILSEWKINQFQLYSEHTFAYKEHKKVWQNSSPITASEIKELDKFCKQHFIELVPNQNSFGHFDRWLPHYPEIAENPKSSRPTALNPSSKKSITFLSKLFNELLPNFSSNQINIGLDEVVLGHGKSKKDCDSTGTGQVFMDFFKKIHTLLEKKNKTVQFWSDMITRHHPEMLSQIPKNAIALEWGYSPGYPFEEYCKKLFENNISFYVCPGNQSWNSIAGRIDHAKENIKIATEVGLKYNAIGILNTDWGDNGHWQHFPISYPGLMYGAAISWDYSKNVDIDLVTSLNIHGYKDKSMKAGKIISELGNLYKLTTDDTTNTSSFRNNSLLHSLILRSPRQENQLENLNQSKLEKTLEKINSIAKDIDKIQLLEGNSKLIIRELKNTIAMLTIACNIGIEKSKINHKNIKTTQNQSWPQFVFTHTEPLSDIVVSEIKKIPPEKRNNIYKSLVDFIKEYEKIWLERNRIGGLKESKNRWITLINEYMPKE